MPPVLTICADCERRALRQPKRGKALAEALGYLTQLLLDRKRLAGLQVVREPCHGNCPLGRVCLTLQRGGAQVEHAFSVDDDPKDVVRKLTGGSVRNA
jgi:hypothetical protein